MCYQQILECCLITRHQHVREGNFGAFEVDNHPHLAARVRFILYVTNILAVDKKGERTAILHNFDFINGVSIMASMKFVASVDRPGRISRPDGCPGSALAIVVLEERVLAAVGLIENFKGIEGLDTLSFDGGLIVAQDEPKGIGRIGVVTRNLAHRQRIRYGWHIKGLLDDQRDAIVAFIKDMVGAVFKEMLVINFEIVYWLAQVVRKENIVLRCGCRVCAEYCCAFSRATC